MKWKMLFRIGLTVVIMVAVLLFYLNNVLHKDNKDRLSELVRSDNQAFQEVLVRHGSHFSNGAQKQESNIAGDVEAGEIQVEQLNARNVDSRNGSRKAGEEGGSWQGQAVEDPAKADNSIKDPAKLGNSVNNLVNKDNSDHGSSLMGDSHGDVLKNGVSSGLRPVQHR